MTPVAIPPPRLRRSTAGLLVIDIQEKLLPAICEQDRVVATTRQLIQGAQVLGMPVFVTEQYRRGLGPTVPAIAETIHEFAPIEKLTFSACAAPGLMAALATRGVQQVLVCGIEAHVCVCQTALDLLAAGVPTFVAGDATSSRTLANHRYALERLRDAGAVVVSTEMALFELLECAGTEAFKRMLALVR
jgi:nicotinamidase-related amidase